ncbi:MAG TPA: histidine kinase dimerization/phospho-acceptor domain-containing protein [Gemmatimonadaceae bacterium]
MSHRLVAMELDDSSASGRADSRDDELALRHARSELRRAAQLAVAGELVASITHDLRQPLTAVEMNISAAIHFLRRRTPALDEAVEALDDALRQQHRMRDALQVLQDLAVRREPRWDCVDIPDIVREVLALVETDALARRVPLVVDAQNGVPTVTGDATLIRQALLNVVLDALEATSRSTTPTAAVQIAIRPDGEAAQVSITHTAPEDDASSTSSWSLALAKSIAAAHSADIAVNATPRSGITVIMRWPTHRPMPLPADDAADA